MIKIRDVNNNIILVHPSEIIGAYQDLQHYSVLELIEQHEIDVIKVNKLNSDKFWLATVKIDDGKQYKHCNYKNKDLKKAIIGALELKKKNNS